MNHLFHITRENSGEYDTYDSVVVCAPNPKEAANIHPSGKPSDELDRSDEESWPPEDTYTIHHIGEANEFMLVGVVLASFNAG